MAWLLLGLYVLHPPRPGVPGRVGALLHGVAFTNFAHTTLYALAENIPTHELLWVRLGTVYNLHGALMILGGLIPPHRRCVRAGCRAGRCCCSPRRALLLFAAGLAANLVLSLLPVRDILQTGGSLLRYIGLMGTGYAVLFGVATRKG